MEEGVQVRVIEQGGERYSILAQLYPAWSYTVFHHPNKQPDGVELHTEQFDSPPAAAPDGDDDKKEKWLISLGQTWLSVNR